MRNQVSAQPKGGKLFQRLGMLAAVLCVALLVGSMALVLNLSHQKARVGSPSIQKTHTTPTVVSTPTSVGTTIYTRSSSNSGDFSALTWSPDSKRIASVVISNGVQIWDAVDGKHLVTVPMPGQNEWAWSLEWSPNSVQVAIATNQEVLIVNGQTGQTVRSYTGNVAMVPTTPTTTGTSYLSSLFPASGGFGFRTTAWSPNGQQMASAISFGASGEIRVWNTQTGAPAFTLSVSGSYVVSSVAWSSDGTYIAAHAYNTQGGDGQTDQVLVWNAATHQRIFRHLDMMLGSDAPVFWQPQSHNLTFVGTVHSGGNYMATIEIWDVTTATLVKQFIGKGGNELAWSPDGKYLAYTGYGGKDAMNLVVIMDVSTDQQVYVYKEHTSRITVLAWSPDGKYIVSGESDNTVFNNGQMTPTTSVARVWIA